MNNKNFVCVFAAALIFFVFAAIFADIAVGRGQKIETLKTENASLRQQLGQ